MARLAIILLAACGFHATPRGGDDDVLPPDAAEPDAKPFDIARDCPATYTAVTGLPATSRYRTAPDVTYRAAHDDCKDDTPGFTHLVVLDTQVEAMALFTFATGQEYWTGTVQTPDQATAIVGWWTITGGSVSDVWALDEPDESGNPEANQYNVAKWAAGGLDDDQVSDTKRVMCECDGKAVDPKIAGYIR